MSILVSWFLFKC